MATCSSLENTKLKTDYPESRTFNLEKVWWFLWFQIPSRDDELVETAILTCIQKLILICWKFSVSQCIVPKRGQKKLYKVDYEVLYTVGYKATCVE